MEFLLNGTWWTLFAVQGFFFPVSRFGHNSMGTWRTEISGAGSLGVLICLVAALFLVGWKGDIGLIVGLLLSAPFIEVAVRILMRMLSSI